MATRMRQLFCCSCHSFLEDVSTNSTIFGDLYDWPHVKSEAGSHVTRYMVHSLLAKIYRVSNSNCTYLDFPRVLSKIPMILQRNSSYFRIENFSKKIFFEWFLSSGLEALDGWQSPRRLEVQ